MTDLTEIAPRFVEMAHQIVWANVATVDTKGRPRTRVLHPLWTWDGTSLTGIVATSPNSVKRAHLDATPYVSVGYWATNQDTCHAECAVEWVLDEAGKQAVWDAFVNAPEPVGYDPAIIPPWSAGPQAPEFAGLRLTPWRLRVMDGALMTRGEGSLLTWSA